MPTYINPAEFLLDLTSSDFAAHHGNIGDIEDEEEAAASSSSSRRIEKIHSDWQCSADAKSLSAKIRAILTQRKDEVEAGPLTELANSRRAPFAKIVIALLHRSFIKSYRDVVAYGIRFAMYIG